MSLFIGWHGIYSEVFLIRRLITDFRRGDLFGRCRYPWAWKKSHRFHRYTQIFLGTFFKVTQISQMTQIFFIHRMTRNLFGDFLRRQLLTDFHGGDLSGRCRYPLRLEKVPQISQIYTDFLFIGWHGIYSEVLLMRQLITDFHRGDLSGRYRYPPGIGICPTKKNLCISVKSVGQNNPHKEKSASSAKSAWQKTTGAYIGREPLASGQSSAKFRE